MAQRPTADYPIDANTTSGTDLSLILNRFQTALESGNSGSSRPAYITAGGLWVKEGDPMELYLYDGTTDQLLYDTSNGINVTEGLWTLVDENDAAGEIQRPSDVLIDGNLTVTGDFVDGDGNPISIIDPATEDGVIATWDNTAEKWTPEGGVVVDANGNVGIGGAATQKLHVTSEGSGSQTALLLQNPTGAAGDAVGLHFVNSSDPSDDAVNGAARIEAKREASNGSSSLSFSTTSSSSLTERMTIDADGKVGIGTNSPDTYSGAANRLVVGGNGSNGITIFTDPSSTAWLSFTSANKSGLDDGLISYDNANGNLCLYSTGSERMRIDASGNVGIGTSDLSASGANAKFAVANGYFNLDDSFGIVWGGGTGRPNINGSKASGLSFANAAEEVMTINNSGRVDITGSLYVNGTPKIGTVDLIKAFSKLRDAVKDEETVESLKESITNWIGGMIEEWESMQSPATQEINLNDSPEVGTMED